MSNSDTFVTLNKINRMNNTPSGNPVYELTTAVGQKFRTAPDSTVAYMVSDTTPMPIRARMTLNESGDVSGFELLDD